MAKSKIIKTCLAFTRWSLDTAQKYTSYFMMLNTCLGSKGFQDATSTVVSTAFAKLNEGDRLGSFGEHISELKWEAFLQHQGSFINIVTNGKAVYENIASAYAPAKEPGVNLEDFELVGDAKPKSEAPFELFKSICLSGIGGIVELNTTGTHLSLSVPAALLISGEITTETIALPLATMLALDATLMLGEELFADNNTHPELSH